MSGNATCNTLLLAITRCVIKSIPGYMGSMLFRMLNLLAPELFC